jgi:hypothetical protein
MLATTGVEVVLRRVSVEVLEGVEVTVPCVVLCKVADVVVLRHPLEQWLAGQRPRAQFPWHHKSISALSKGVTLQHPEHFPLGVVDVVGGPVAVMVFVVLRKVAAEVVVTLQPAPEHFLMRMSPQFQNFSAPLPCVLGSDTAFGQSFLVLPNHE